MGELTFVDLGPGEYDRAKAIFNRAKHPGFIGRELFFRAATSGKAVVAVDDDGDVGVALIAKDKLLALSVVVTAQGRGVGPALMRRLQPKWVSAIDSRVGFFERLGYAPMGPPKVGQNGKHATQLMVLGDAGVPGASATPATTAERVETKPAKRQRATPATTAERVERIMEMMHAMQWRRGESAPDLAEEWGLAVNTVEQLASEASRAVARAATDPQRVTEDVSVVLSRDLHRASESAEYGAVAKIADTWTRIVGARAPERHVVAHVQAPQDAPGELAEVEAAIEALERRRDELRAALAVPVEASDGP